MYLFLRFIAVAFKDFFYESEIFGNKPAVTKTLDMPMSKTGPKQIRAQVC